MAKDIFGNEIIQQQKTDKFGNFIQSSENLSSLEKNKVTEDQKAGAGTYAAALGTEIAIAEGIKFGATTALGPIGYVLGGLGGGALGSYQAQKMINPDGEISWGRLIADSFINLLPASKLTKGAKTVGDVTKRTAGAGAAIGVGGVAIEKGVDDSRWNLMTGNREEIYSLARKSYLVAKENPNAGSHDMIHTENFVLVDPNRRIRGFYDGTDSESMERLIEDIYTLKKEF